MGLGAITAAVVDAGPLIHLSEIDSLSLLQIFEILHLPDAVWSETVGQGRLSQAEVMELGNIHQSAVLVSEVRRFVQENALAHLQDGECQCLYVRVSKSEL